MTGAHAEGTELSLTDGRFTSGWHHPGSKEGDLPMMKRKEEGVVKRNGGTGRGVCGGDRGKGREGKAGREDEGEGKRRRKKKLRGRRRRREEEKKENRKGKGGGRR